MTDIPWSVTIILMVGFILMAIIGIYLDGKE